MREKTIAFILTAMLTAMTFGLVIAQTYTLGSYSEPFCIGGVCDFFIVYGEDAKPADLVGGSNIIIRLGADSYELKSTGAGTTTTSIEGESFRLDSSGDPFNYDQSIYNIDPKITGTDLTILADQTFDDNKGTNKGDYDYTQKIDFTDATGTVKFVRKEAGDKEADTYLYFDDTSTKYMYTYTLEFTTDVPVANAADLEQNDITVLGTEYSIVDATAAVANVPTKLVLMGGTSKVTGDHGEEYTVTVGDTTYTVIPKIYGSSETVIFDVTVGGTTETTDALSTGDTYTLADGNLIGLTSWAASSKEGVSDTATFFVGANKLTLENGQKVKVGDTKVDGTAVTITNSTTGWDTLVVTYVPEDDVYIAEDGEYEDPVFGAFKFMFLGMDKTTEHIDIDPDGSDKVEITVNNKDGYELKFNLFYANSTDFWLGEDDDNQLIITNGDEVKATAAGGSDLTALEGTRFLYDFNGVAHLIEIIDIDTTNSQCDFRVISLGNKDYEDQTCAVTNANVTFTFMDSNFILKFNNTSGQQGVTFNEINDNGGDSFITTEYGAEIRFDETGNFINITEVDASTSTGGSPDASSNISLTWDSTNERININTPTGVGSFLKKVDGDNYNKEVATAYGTLWAYNSEDQGYVDIDYPDEEADAKVYIASIGATTTTTEGTEAGTVKEAIPISDSISKLDTDIPNPETVSENLILVGGSCVNDHVQTLVDSGKLDAKYTCTGGVGEGWGEGKGYIWLIEDCFGKTGRTCLVVAGTKAADTRTACSVLQKYDTLLVDSTATAIEITSATTAGITPL